MAQSSLKVRGIKITVPLRPEELPREGVPMEGPLGDLDWEVAIEGSELKLPARLNGKNYRRILKSVDASGGNVGIVFQATLRVSAETGALALESAGFQVNERKPRPDAPAPARPAPVASASPAASDPAVAAPAATTAPEPMAAAAPAPVAPAKPEPIFESKPAEAPAPLPGTALPGRRIYVPQARPLPRRS